MIEWLLGSIDPTRAHDVGWAVSWHARCMTLGWGFLAPAAVLIARFCKVTPWQNWPAEVDNHFWWRCHWVGQTTVCALTLAGLYLILTRSNDGTLGLHGVLGYSVIALLALQVLLGVTRGSKGGPSDPRPDGSLHGDHYDMTRWRLMFEHAHKTVGYLLILLAAATIIAGLWTSNAPRWMWLVIGGWWIGLASAFLVLQRRGWAIDTYSAIWGLDPSHPGNQRPVPGWGMRRPDRHQPGE